MFQKGLRLVWNRVYRLEIQIIKISNMDLSPRILMFTNDLYDDAY